MSVVRKNLIEAVEKAIRGDSVIFNSAAQPGARLERLGTIFSRTTGLIKSGVMSEVDIPLWYDVYKAFPPKYAPIMDRPPVKDIEVKTIFYPEDQLRAKINKREMINFFANNKTETQKKVDEFKKLKRETPSQSNEEIINKILQQR